MITIYGSINYGYCFCTGTVLILLSTHADRQGVDILVTFCLFVCTVTDFSGISGEDKASGVKFCMAVHGRPGQGMSHFGNFAPQKPKIGRIDH